MNNIERKIIYFSAATHLEELESGIVKDYNYIPHCLFAGVGTWIII